MKILLTGHNGYIGSVMAPVLQAAGHEVVGLDTYYYEGCDFGPSEPDLVAVRKDLRDVEVSDLVGFDAVIHLAALSNDPVGNLNSECTHSINSRASVRLAEVAKRAGVPRYLFASSCSLYGVAGPELLDESAAFNPITPYGESKVMVEAAVSRLASDSFSPTFLRNATAYGVSPRLRADLVVNNLVGHAFASGEVLIQSDGTPWRPLVHVEDIARAFLAVLQASPERVHNQAFNVGLTAENYQISQLAAMVEDVVPGSRVKYAEGGGPDPRSYRVSCDKIAAILPAFRPRWTVRQGIEQLYEAYRASRLTRADFLGTKYLRIKQILLLKDQGRLDDHLRWRPGRERSAGVGGETGRA